MIENLVIVESPAKAKTIEKFLGKDFLIHGGGLDLVFPHHENEIAQTVCAGKKSAKYWIHNGLLTISKQKMSKSLGNSPQNGHGRSLNSLSLVFHFLSKVMFTLYYRKFFDYNLFFLPFFQ